MNNAITLKGGKNSLTILVNEPLRYDEFLEELKKKFLNSNGFFKDASVALCIKGICVTEKQEYEIINLIEYYAGMHVICIVDDDEVNNSRFYQAITDKLYLQNNRSGLIFRGNIKNNECLETYTSVVILGDVEQGGKVISKGNVIVIGRICGSVLAGADSDNFHFISALGMNFKKIQIGDVVMSSSENLFHFMTGKAKIAYRINEHIYIRNIR